MKMLFSEVKQRITKHEGLRLKPYRDSVGKLTIGVGRNLDDKGILPSEAESLLHNDIMDAESDVKALYEPYAELTAIRQYVLIDMCFNMGRARLGGFKKMLAALRARMYNDAADEMLNSKWAQQVGPRATELAALMRVG
jgi:lysozyme